MKSVKDTLAPALRFLIVSSEAVKRREGAVPYREMSTPRNAVSCMSAGGQTVLKLVLRPFTMWRAPQWLSVPKAERSSERWQGSPARPASPSALSTIWLSHCDSATIKAPQDPCSSTQRGFVCCFLLICFYKKTLFVHFPWSR